MNTRRRFSFWYIGRVCYSLLITVFILTNSACSKDGDESATIPDPDSGINKQENLKATGDSANDLLSDTTYPKVELEILFTEDMAPTASSVNNLRAFIEETMNKPGGIEVIQREITIAPQASYSISDIVGIEDENRQAYTSGDTIAITALFLDGEYSENTTEGSVLGIAYRNTSFVIFEATIREFSQDVFAPSLTTLESTVIHHELGHLLGLVNNGTTPQSAHHDAANGAHCDVDGCLMYWQAETGEGLLNMLSGGSIAELDAQCKADLTANGGK